MPRRSLPQTRAAKVLAMLGICSVVMLIALDQTVVGTAMPSIVADLKGYALYSWTASAYLLTNAILMLLAGRLGDLFGRKRFVLGSIVFFTLASALCGMARSMPELIAARVLQGIGGGMLSGLAFACVSDLFPDHLQRMRWQAMLSATYGLATAVGPTLGGFLTEHFGWRTVFYVNLPVALVAFPMVWRYFPAIPPHPSDDERSLDWSGVVLFSAALSLILLGTEGAREAGILSAVPIALLVSGLVVSVFFIRHQLLARAPLLPPRLLRNAAVLRLGLLSACSGASLFLLVFYSPLLLQGGLGLSPRFSGLLLTPLLLCITFGSIFNGRLLPRLRRPERMLAHGFLGLALLALVLALVRVEQAPWILSLLFGVCGLCFGLQLPNLTVQMQSAAEPRDMGVASALVQTTRVMGSLSGAVLGAVVVNTCYAYGMTRLLGGAEALGSEASELLRSPQILVRIQEQDTLARLAAVQGFDAAAYLHAAREQLISGVHLGFGACSLICLLAWWVSLKVPPLRLRAS